MSTTRTKSEAQILENYRVALENVETHPELAKNLADFGYDSNLITQGKLLLEATRKAYDFNKREAQESSEARAIFDAKLDAVLANYSIHRKKAKVAFRNDALTLKKLDLLGPIPVAYIKRVEMMKSFYLSVHSEQRILDKLARFKFFETDITDAFIAIAQMERARTAYLMEVGESQDATKAKDIAFAQVDEWMRDFYTVSKIAMADKPQLLEALGLTI